MPHTTHLRAAACECRRGWRRTVWRQVKSTEISFEAYGSMALAEMRKLREEALNRFGLLDARIVHRVTTVKAGDNIVFIAAGAEHRAAAFDACRWMIDELKHRVPIWKKKSHRKVNLG